MATKTVEELREFINKNLPSGSELRVSPFRVFFFYLLEHLTDIPSGEDVDKLIYNVFGTQDLDNIDFRELFGEDFTGTSLVEYLQYLQDNPIGSITTENVKSDVTVGAINAGQEIPAGTNIQQFLTLLLNKVFNPTFVAPSLTLTHDAGLKEIGETINLKLTNNYNPGTILGSLVSGVWQPSAIQGNRAGSIISSSIDGTNGTTKSITNYVVKESETFNSVLQYGVGPQPKNSKNENYQTPLPSGVLNSTVTIIGGLRRFSGSMENLPSSGEHIRAALLETSVINTNNSFVFRTGITNRIFVIAIPGNEAIEAINMQTNEELKFKLSTINSIPDAAGTFRNYSVYILENAVPFTNNYTIQVTLK